MFENYIPSFILTQEENDMKNIYKLSSLNLSFFIDIIKMSIVVKV